MLIFTIQLARVVESATSRHNLCATICTMTSRSVFANHFRWPENMCSACVAACATVLVLRRWHSVQPGHRYRLRDAGIRCQPVVDDDDNDDDDVLFHSHCDCKSII